MTLTKEILSREVAALLELPFYRRGGESYKIVQTIFKVVVSALLRGESVYIKGFGTFSIYTRKPTRSPCYYFYGRKKGGLPWSVKDLPAKKFVVFRPSKPLMRMLNDPHS